jgi:hypothetical protein
MFGKTKSDVATSNMLAATNSILVLDVRDRSSLSFLDNYPVSDDLDTPASTNISGGAIAGIVVGTLAGVCTT